MARRTETQRENSMECTPDDLKRISVFSSLDDLELKELSPYLAQEQVRRKEKIFSEGDPPEWFYIVVAGKVKMTKLSHEGRELILEVIGPADFFGAFAVLKGFPYPANAVAMEDSTLLKMSRQSLIGIIDRFPTIMYDITANLGQRTKELYETLKNIALGRVESRIAALLLKLADRVGSARDDGVMVIGMKLTKQDIAEMVGTTVETSIRIMSRLKKAGIIEDDGGRIAIRSREKLKSVVNSVY